MPPTAENGTPEKEVTPYRTYAGYLSMFACFAFLATNIAANGIVAGQSLYEVAKSDPTNDERYLSAKLSQLGKRVVINCLPLADVRNATGDKNLVTLGYSAPIVVLLGTKRVYTSHLPVIVMNDEDCKQGARALRDAESHNYETSMVFSSSLGRLTHETEHIMFPDVSDESVTECFNTQRLRSKLEQLNYPSDWARKISNSYAASDWRLPSYINANCRPGTKLDLGVNGAFPPTPTDGPLLVQPASVLE